MQVPGKQEVLPGERTLDKAFVSLERLKGVQTQWCKRGERLYRLVDWWVIDPPTTHKLA
jgi:hypothetical protein